MKLNMHCYHGSWYPEGSCLAIATRQAGAWSPVEPHPELYMSSSSHVG
ncbi:hypothetical protein GF407_03235 [candidate division KSB1 bacterium]|nr:hypothetical protein [candidate division KSB1 bacterium]